MILYQIILYHITLDYTILLYYSTLYRFILYHSILYHIIFFFSTILYCIKLCYITWYSYSVSSFSYFVCVCTCPCLYLSVVPRLIQWKCSLETCHGLHGHTQIERNSDHGETQQAVVAQHLHLKVLKYMYTYNHTYYICNKS